FQEKEADREARKLADLAPAIEAAFARKRSLPAPPDVEIPTYQAYGNTVALTDADIAKMPEGNRKRALAFRKIAEGAERAERRPPHAALRRAAARRRRAR